MIPQVPPPDPASDFGIERTAPMNTTPFPGHGMRADSTMQAASPPDPYDAFADAVSEVLEQQKEPATDRGIFERSIAARRAEKLKQQEIARAALAKVKALTLSLRAMEDALDGLLVAEA